MNRYFDYLFYVDFEASMADPNSQNALKHLKVLFFSERLYCFLQLDFFSEYSILLYAGVCNFLEGAGKLSDGHWLAWHEYIAYAQGWVFGQ